MFASPLSEKHAHEFIEIQRFVLIMIMLFDHGFQVLIADPFPNLPKCDPQIVPIDLPVAVLVKYLEDLYKLLRGLVLLHLPLHEPAELFKVDLAIPIDVHLPYHGLDLCLSRVLS